MVISLGYMKRPKRHQVINKHEKKKKRHENI